MGILRLIFGDIVDKLYSRVTTIVLRSKGVSVGKNLLVLGKLKLKIRGQYSDIIIGNNVQLMGEVDLRNREQGKIIVGDKVKIDHGCRLIAANSATIRIGSESRIMFYSNINAGEDITIGSKTGIAAFSVIASSAHRTESGKRYLDQAYDHSPIIIGDGVQIGSHSVILPGVTIGTDALISTHSVVIDHVPNNTIVGGIPARPLGKRKGQEIASIYSNSSTNEHNDVKARLIEIFCMLFPSIGTVGLQEFELLDQDSVNEWNSLNQLKLFLVIEEEFEIEIAEESIVNFTSFSNILNYLLERTRTQKY